MSTVRKIQPSGIHAALNQSLYDGRGTTRRPDGTDDFGFSHAHVEAPPGSRPEEKQRGENITDPFIGYLIDDELV
ncbi:MAG: hypothetical protein NTAFB01_27150 [Nitrospira sp.]